MAKRHRFDDETGPCLATAHHKQARRLAGQGLAVRSQIVEARIEEVQVRKLAYRANHGIDFDGEFSARHDIGALATTGIFPGAFAHLGKLDTDHFAVFGQDARSSRTLKQVDALCFDGFGFRLVGRELASWAIQCHMDFGDTQSAGHRGRIQGGDPAADDCHPLPDVDGLAQVNLAQEGRRRNHPFGVFAFDAERMVTGRNASRQTDGVVALLEQRRRVFNGRVCLQDDTQRQDVVNVLLEHAFGQPVSRNTDAHHAPGDRQRLVDGHAVAHFCQVMGCGQASRACAHDGDPFRPGTSRSFDRFASISQGEIHHKTFEGHDPDRVVHQSAAAMALTGMVARAATHAWERIILFDDTQCFPIASLRDQRDVALGTLSCRAGIPARGST